MTRTLLSHRRLTGLLTTLLLLSLVLALVSRTVSSNLLGGSEPLSPQQAFLPMILASDDRQIHIGFTIADGYYLYRDKTHFAIDHRNASVLSTLRGGTALSVGDPSWTEAQVTHDDFFGEQSIFRFSAQATLPWSGQHDGSTNVLTVTYQGCADIGLCYPPTTVSLPLSLPISATPMSSAMADPVLESPVVRAQNDSLAVGLLGDTITSDELLPPELAYLPQIISATERQIAIRWHIEPGYYLYKDKLAFRLADAGGAEVIGQVLDPGIEQVDEFFGKVSVYRNSAHVQLTLDPAVDLDSRLRPTLHIDYQGCADIGVCFPPSQHQLTVDFDVSSPTIPAFSSVTEGPTSPIDAMPAALETSSSNGVSSFETTRAAGTKTVNRSSGDFGSSDNSARSEQDRLSSLLASSSLWLNVATFFGLGLLLAFTPCVLPMVPILSSLIAGQGQSMSAGRAFRLSLIYVLVMASTYALAGVAVGLTGYNVQAFLQNPWVLSLIALLFVLLSLAMFGFYELQMPTALQTRLTQWSNQQHGGQITGVASMGFISALIVGPCITAPLAGALIYIARTGDALIGGAALFALGLGMGAPLLLIGTSAGRLLPKAGAWMNTTKQFFGILLLGMAIYMLSRFLPVTVSMALFGALAIMSAIYLGATDSIDRQSSHWQRFGKGVGALVGLYGVALLLGALSGTASYRTPLRGLISSTGAPLSAEHLRFTPVKSVAGLQQVVERASAEGRSVMLDFYADWCISCKEMEAFTFVDSRVQSLLENTVLVQADVTANDDEDQKLLQQFDLFGPPGIVFYAVNGKEIPAARVVGFMNAEEFGNHLERYIGG